MITALRQSRVWGPPTPCLLRCNRRLSTPSTAGRSGWGRRDRWAGGWASLQVTKDSTYIPGWHQATISTLCPPGWPWNAIFPAKNLGMPARQPTNWCQGCPWQRTWKSANNTFGLPPARLRDNCICPTPPAPYTRHYNREQQRGEGENNRERRAGPSLAGSSTRDGWWQLDEDDETAPATSGPCVSLLWAQSQHNLRGVAFPPWPLDLSEY